MNPSGVSLKEIASLVGCSPRAAAAVLNPGNSNIRVGEATQQRIIATAREMGYRTNELARAMATGRNSVLGAVVAPFMPEHVAQALAGVIDTATDMGYMVKILTLPTYDSTDGIVERAQEWRLAGLIAIGLFETGVHSILVEATLARVPLAYAINTPGSGHISVTTDDFQGTRLVVEHLFDLGHRHIGFLGGSIETPESVRRELSFRQLLAEKGLPVVDSWIRQSSWVDLSLIKQAGAAILSGERPTAVVCAGDPIALVLSGVAHHMGLELPRDLSITGYANFFMSAFTEPGLTTIDQNFGGMGKIAARSLIEQVDCAKNGDSSKVHSFVPARLVVRDSTAPPKAGT